MKKKFSLIELIISIAVISILMVIAMPMYDSIMDDAYKVKVKKDLMLIKDQMKRFRIEQGHWPTSIAQLCKPIINRSPTQVLLNDDTEYVKYINDDTSEILIDPWNLEYTMEARSLFLHNGMHEPMQVSIPPYSTSFSLWIGCQSQEMSDDPNDFFWIFVGNENIPGKEPKEIVEY